MYVPHDTPMYDSVRAPHELRGEVTGSWSEVEDGARGLEWGEEEERDEQDEEEEDR